ncbi:hypothetical protein PROFUN_16594 [Planoprotostelium fungivorum]|uniref:Uncharacterized protein n=1 Tax=Planoprotostelium fungivorum TaxID=1890364 RepID=A0A2P6MP11_9EUKA|nr:hypothetical protein PROFUN_16594 [Planoprotostelium fungivorum]
MGHEPAINRSFIRERRPHVGVSLPFQFSNADFVEEDLSLDLAVSLAVLSPFSGSWPLVEGLHSVANCSVPFIRFIAFKIYRWIRRSDLSHPSLDEEAKFHLTPLPIIILWIGEDNSTGQQPNKAKEMSQDLSVEHSVWSHIFHQATKVNEALRGQPDLANSDALSDIS